MHGHAAHHLCPVGHGAAPGQTFHKKGLPAVQHREIRVLIEDLLDVFHKRHCRLPKLKGGGIAVDQLPQANSQLHGPARPDIQEPVSGELPDQPMGSGERQPGPVRQFGQLQVIAAFREGSNNADHAVHHRITGA
jgi:hypothetical protein